MTDTSQRSLFCALLIAAALAMVFALEACGQVRITNAKWGTATGQAPAVMDDIIPMARRITWTGNVGVEGGIPIRSTIYTNFTGDTTGVTNVATALQAALDACPTNQVVYLPAGTYRVDSTLKVRSYTTFRGAGPTNTILQFTNLNSEKIVFGRTEAESARYYNDGTMTASAANILGGDLAVGTTNIHIATAHSSLEVGALMIIDQLNDGGIFPLGTNLVSKYDAGQGCGQCSRESGERAMMQTVEILSVTDGTNITFRPGLFYPRRAALDPEAVSVGTNGAWAGVEDMKISTMSGNDAYDNGETFDMTCVKNCWVKNCESDYTSGDHVEIKGSYRCEVRDSYFHDGFRHGNGSAEVGVMLGMSSGCLYENNIIRRAHIVYINWGSSGNVVAYNYLDNNYRTSNPTHMTGGLFWHGAHPMMNLIEGNVLTKVHQDNVWGSASHETIHRNFVQGVDTHWPPYDARGIEQTNSATWPNYVRSCIYLGASTRFWNVVGNVFGSENFRTNWSTTNGPGFGTPTAAKYAILAPTNYNSFAYSTESWAWVVGQTSTGTNVWDTTVWTNTIKHGNWDSVQQATTWDAAITNQTLSNSYYLTNTPSWWPAGKTFPPFTPGQTAHITNLPAAFRYQFQYPGGL